MRGFLQIAPGNITPPRAGDCRQELGVMIDDPRSDSRLPKIVGPVRRQGRIDRRAGGRATARSGQH
jgi:hypothetical protein